MEIIVKDECPYFPCSSAKEHVCSMCFCPFYICKMPETGGKWFTTIQGFMIWDCSGCVIAHEREIVETLDLDINEMDDRKIQIAKAKLRMYINEL